MECEDEAVLLPSARYALGDGSKSDLGEGGCPGWRAPRSQFARERQGEAGKGRQLTTLEVTSPLQEPVIRLPRTGKGRDERMRACSRYLIQVPDLLLPARQVLYDLVLPYQHSTTTAVPQVITYYSTMGSSGRRLERTSDDHLVLGHRPPPERS
jgi:hypothetical protein